jgi:hypothetical protein
MAAVRSRVALVIAALGLFVAACLVGDHGAARAAVGQPTGPLVANDRGDGAVLVAQGLRPGESRMGEVTVTNAGDAAGAFALGSETTSYSGAPLSNMLDLAVEDVTPGRARTVAYVGKLGSVSNVALGTMAQDEQHRYRFTVTLPLSAGNVYQAASAAVTFVWRTSAVAGTPAPTSTPAATPTPAATKPTPTPRSTTTPKPNTTPKATLTASARQTGAKGSVATWVGCSISCTAVLSGTAVDGDQTLALRTVRRTLSGRVRLRIMLPKRAREALSEQRVLAVRLRLKATMGTRVVIARRTIRVAPARR